MGDQEARFTARIRCRIGCHTFGHWSDVTGFAVPRTQGRVCVRCLGVNYRNERPYGGWTNERKVWPHAK